MKKIKYLSKVKKIDVEAFKKSSWFVPFVIFTVSILALLFLTIVVGLDAEKIRAFAMWFTMTIGASGLYVAIEKFGIDKKSDIEVAENKIPKIYLKSIIPKIVNGKFNVSEAQTNLDVIFEIFNRSEEDIYIKNIEIIQVEDNEDDKQFRRANLSNQSEFKVSKIAEDIEFFWFTALNSFSSSRGEGTSISYIEEGNREKFKLKYNPSTLQSNIEIKISYSKNSYYSKDIFDLSEKFFDSGNKYWSHQIIFLQNGAIN